MMSRPYFRICAGASVFLVAMLLALSSAAEEFQYMPPGELVEGSGTGLADYNVYVPGMRFPIEEAPAYPNSQVWGHGGMHGPGGGQCHEDNYSYPWWDNYCESRQWDMPLCPSGQGHQGQDIRPRTCDDKTHWAVAAEAGTITHIGSYSVNLTTADGTRHRYLHMDPATLPVSVGDTVQRGQRLGLVSNAFGGTPTTIHLHYDIQQAVDGLGQVYVPTYMSLVESYKDLIGQSSEPCDVVGSQGGVIDNGDPCFRLLGNVSTWRTEEAGHEGSLHWTYAYDGDEPDGYARWILHFEEAGSYVVEAYVEPEYAQSEQARYVVRAAGVEHELFVDQSQAQGWTELGEFDFGADDDEWVEIYDNTGEPLSEWLQFVADALRLTPVVEEPDEDEDEESENEGDDDEEEEEPDEPDEEQVEQESEDDEDLPVGAGFFDESDDSQIKTRSSCGHNQGPASLFILLAFFAAVLVVREGGLLGLRRARRMGWKISQ